MATTSTSIVNAALEQTGTQAQIASLVDGSPEANAAAVVYPVAVQFMLRELDPDFARTRVSLSVAAITNPSPWSNAYTYPAACLRLRQLAPPIGGYDIFDPQPIRGEVAFDTGAGKVILTNQANAIAVFTTSAVTEAQFDSVFIEILIRRLSNPLAMAIAGRPDFATELLQESERYSQLAELSDEL